MLSFSDLTEMASPHEPGDILGHSRPPVTFCEQGTSRVKTVMTHIIVSRGEQEEPTIFWHNYSVIAFGILFPELIVVSCNKKLCAVSHERVELVVR